MRTPTTDLDALFAAAPPFYTCEQAAELSGHHLKTLQRLCKRGVLQAVKPGKAYRIPAAALRRWLEKGIS
jgi:excisionase family DNA binding protein